MADQTSKTANRALAQDSAIWLQKPNKFNEIFSTANNFLGPARAKNPFVKKANGGEAPTAGSDTQETPAAHSA
jgi:hypothetical protein